MPVAGQSLGDSLLRYVQAEQGGLGEA